MQTSRTVSHDIHVYLLPGQAPNPEFPDVSVCIASAAPLSVLQLLQMMQRPCQAKGCAVEVPPPDVKGEQEFAGEDQLTAPTGQGVATDG